MFHCCLARAKMAVGLLFGPEAPPVRFGVYCNDLVMLAKHWLLAGGSRLGGEGGLPGLPPKGCRSDARVGLNPRLCCCRWLGCGKAFWVWGSIGRSQALPGFPDWRWRWDLARSPVGGPPSLADRWSACGPLAARKPIGASSTGGLGDSPPKDTVRAPSRVQIPLALSIAD
jgi:hypothetical protein